MPTGPQPPPTNSRIALVVSDVDGTLVNLAKAITPLAKQTVDDLRRAGIRFTVTSSRPPRGLRSVINELELTEPVAAFNGGLLVTPHYVVLNHALLDSVLVEKVLAIIARHNIDAWVFNEHDWLVHDLQGPHVQREIRAVQFQPRVVASFDGATDRVGKIVAVTDDRAAILACEADVKNACGDSVAASCSQTYYLDVTHPDANKGRAMSIISENLGIPIAQIATIGDGENDVLMFRNSGLSIAMGNATEEVKSAATFVTGTNNEEGFANAIRERILNAAVGQTISAKP